MKTEKIITTETEGLSLWYWNKETEDSEKITQANMDEYAKKFKCSPELVDTLLNLVGNIVEMFKQDLKDIWERLDRIENQ